MKPPPPSEMPPEANEFGWSTPAKDMWNDMNPLGRALFFVPCVLCVYSFGSVLVAILYPVCWLSERRFAVKWIGELERGFKKLFGNPNRKPPERDHI